MLRFSRIHLKKSVDMTQGSIIGNIINFALPLFCGNIFQQLYNTVDSIVVGNFVGKEALAAVGSVDSVIFTFIGFFVGMSTGAGVVISQYFGAKDEKNVSVAVHTTIVFTFILSVICTVSALLALPLFLKLLAIPDDVYEESRVYLQLYFAGVSGMLFYNMGSGILRAVGDSRRPLFFLLFSSILNIGLDLLFVAVFRMGVAGAAWATIISQFLSAILVLVVLFREKEIYRLQVKKLRLDRFMLRNIVKIGLPGGLRMMIVAFSNVFVQSYINAFGSAAMAGWSSYGKIDKICILPSQSIDLAITTFAGQNLGAGDVERTKKGTRTALLMNWAVSFFLIVVTMVFAEKLVLCFNQDADVLRFGTMFIRYLMPFYMVLSVNSTFSGSLQGAGNTRIPVAIMMGSFILVRQIYLFVVSRMTTSVLWIVLGYPVGWCVSSILMTIYYHRTDLSRYRIIRQG
ncbi:MAG: MATE family efflux transporter [Treponemataceae bacterium]|nr:MATE family efflux transporter [Treponemataceae bacterium]